MPGKAVFVQDDPEGSVAVQSPAFSALGSSSEASQLAARSMRVSGVVRCRFNAVGSYRAKSMPDHFHKRIKEKEKPL